MLEKFDKVFKIAGGAGKALKGTGFVLQGISYIPVIAAGIGAVAAVLNEMNEDTDVAEANDDMKEEPAEA